MAVERILIVKPSAFGDIVHSLPFLEALRRNYPKAHIAWVVARANADLLSGHPDLDEVILFERERWGGLTGFARRAREMWGFVRTLRRGRFDLAVDLQGLFRSALVSFLSGAKQRVGFADARELGYLFYNVRVPRRRGDEPVHAVDRYLDVARTLGLVLSDRPVFHVAVGDEARKFAREALAAVDLGARPVVVMLPSSRWQTKRWPGDCFAELGDRVASSLGATVVFLGSQADEPLVERIRGMMKERSVSLAGKTTVKQSAAILEKASAVVASDTGPMHLAVALGCAVVSLYGPTSPARTGPYGGDARLFVSTRECAPCFRELCEDAKCMRDILVDDVYEAVRGFLEKRS
jgi:lipopolysaccharide heptosyltransferase I